MKIAVDTNIVLRLITGDDEKLLAKVRTLIKKHEAGEIFVSYAVLLETQYVLAKVYKYPKDIILEALEDLMRVEQFHFEQETAVRLALMKYGDGYSFSYALIGELGGTKNVKTYTFDQALKKNSAFVVINS